MRVPGDISGNQLATSLRALGYGVTRQTGSHQRLTTELNGQHHVTVPTHSPVRVGTLAAILDAVAAHHGLARDELLEKLNL